MTYLDFVKRYDPTKELKRIILPDGKTAHTWTTNGRGKNKAEYVHLVIDCPTPVVSSVDEMIVTTVNVRKHFIANYANQAWREQ